MTSRVFPVAAWGATLAALFFGLTPAQGAQPKFVPPQAPTATGRNVVRFTPPRNPVVIRGQVRDVAPRPNVPNPNQRNFFAPKRFPSAVIIPSFPAYLGLPNYAAGNYGSGYGGYGGGSSNYGAPQGNQPGPIAALPYQPREPAPPSPSALDRLGLPTTAGQLSWPLGLRILPPAAETAPLRQQLEADLRLLAEQAAADSVNPQLVQQSSDKVQRLRVLLSDSAGRVPYNAANEARRFLQTLEEAIQRHEGQQGER